jgi:hypothetical protein
VARGPRQHLNEDAQAATLIGQSLMVFAAISLAPIINFIVQLIILAVEVAQAIATAFVSFGATTAEAPGFVAATRLILRHLIREVVQNVTTSIKTIFQRAQHLLRKVASRRGSHAATDAARHTPGIPGPMTVRRFEGKSMLKEFRYETNPNHPLNRRGWSVRRLDLEEREQYRVVVGEDGLVRRANDGSLFDTQAATSLHSDEGGRAIFIMDKNGNL